MLDFSKLNEAQRKAVMYGEGPLLVLAGPGSGKTFTITQRIFYLMEVKQIPPEEILVLTFTKDAAKSMQQRFQEQSNRIYPVNFGTFHSVFYHILLHSKVIQSNKLLDNNCKRRIVRSVLMQFFEKKENQKKICEEDITNILNAIGYYKNTASLEKAKTKLPQEWQEDFTHICEEYEKERHRQGGLDFDDMLSECRKLFLEKKEFCLYWQRRFPYILIDEFQDINPIQYEVIKLLAAKPYSIFAVGDDDQAIYGFRGSNPACLSQFAEEFHAEKILLNINYRSRAEIIESSLKVISENKERFPKKLLAAPKNENLSEETNAKTAFCVKSFLDRDKKYAYLLQQLSCKKADEVCAVLFRTNSQMQTFAAGLTREGVPFSMKEKAGSIYEHFIVKDILAYLRLAAGENRRELWLQILNKPSRYLSREILGNETKQMKNNPEMELLRKQVTHLKSLSPYLAVQYISKVIGYERYLKELAGLKRKADEKFLEWSELLAWLKEDAGKYTCLDAWLEGQKRYRDREQESSGQEPNGQKLKRLQMSVQTAPVQLMTVHAAKGLEFDKVYIPDCNESVFPHGTMLDIQDCEEERRIFYVAMTRAKKSLELLYLTGTRESPRLPSRFLNPLLNQNPQQA